MRCWIAGCALALAHVLITMPAWAEEAPAGYSLGKIWEQTEITTQLAFEPRWFPSDPSFPDQFDGVQFSGFIQPEIFWENDDRDAQVALTPFLRLDLEDDERTHFDMREAYFRRILDEWEVLVGLNQVFWGVTESRHLINIINQIDTLEDTAEEDFLGQPMVQVAKQTDIGRFDVFLMPYFRERTFAGPDGRLRGPIVVDTDRAEYESDLGELRPDLAFRYSHFIGDFDLGLHYFHGTGREPDFRLSADGTRLIPRYVVINQVGADIQYTTDAWLWKFEGLVREGQGNTFAAAVAGFEYTLFQVLETDADLGLLAEALYDGRDENPAVFPAALEQDVFLGTRLALNDIQDTALLFGVTVDVEDGLGGFRLEAERRFGDTWFVELEAQAFLEDERGNPASVFDRDSFVTLRISKYF